ncbi:MAG: DUF2652 domain-containing protein [Anaerolineales bacterium]|jgi:hypothetical protein
MAERGYLVIADITGYTAFLSGTELEHAQDTLGSLLELLVNNTKDPLQISRLEGDAVISFANAGSLLKTQTLLENLETTYVAFRQAQQRMRLNTTCTCKACRNIPNLDLKFVVHFGEFMLQDIGAYTELIGPEVNLIHRLVKNSITESTGIKAYAAFTQAAVEAIDIKEQTQHMRKLQEPDEYLGQVTLYIEDLHVVWEQQRELNRIIIQPEEALIVVDEEFNIEPVLVWEYLTTPEHRAILLQADSISVEAPAAGRISSGSVYVCAHGEERIRQAIVDWHPFDYFTFQMDGMIPGTSNLTTVHLLPMETGTCVRAAISHASGPDGAREEWDVLSAREAPGLIRSGCEKLKERIKRDIDLGIIVPSKSSTPTADEITSAAEAALSHTT